MVSGWRGSAGSMLCCAGEAGRMGEERSSGTSKNSATGSWWVADRTKIAKIGVTNGSG